MDNFFFLIKELLLWKRVIFQDKKTLLYDPESPLHFYNDIIVIIIQVVEEVDRFKRDPSEKISNVKRFSWLLDVFREIGNLSSEVRINKDLGQIKVAFFRKENTDRLPYELNDNIN